MKKFLLTVLFVAQPLIAAPPPSEPAQAPEFRAAPRININREQAGKEGVSVNELSKRVQAYLEEREEFTLDELRALEIPTFDGKTVRLSRIATVEVTFRKAPPKTPAEQVGTGQAAAAPESNSGAKEEPRPEKESVPR